MKGTPLAARVIFESLPLEEIVQQQQESALAQAAAAGSASAQIKLGAWLFTRHGRSEEGTRWLNAAAAAGAEPATAALAALQKANAEDVLQNLLRALDASGHLNGPVVAVLAARQALAANDLGHASASLRAALALTPALSGELAELIAAAVQLAEQTAQPLVGMAPNAIEAALDMRVSRGDRDASYALGRALCGLPCGVLAPTDLAGRPNMRKGVALLLRAADAGCDEAWLHLYRMHGDHSLSVANPQMARFCLRSAARWLRPPPSTGPRRALQARRPSHRRVSARTGRAVRGRGCRRLHRRQRACRRRVRPGSGRSLRRACVPEHRPRTRKRRQA